ncbi:hypothetical protein HPB48_026159 [Haemaphysalis longicornis]|uniref:Uncharacterized protein n=1 Tax=Haemaphysalis longicornis TaxID=44386 RepID=A0A9J6H8V3_HAELO|nr:hypothetical protein HPB48_026159 [Haemaphysalis longicornis]
MATAEKRKAKLEYFHESEDFRVPKSTYYDRLKRQRRQSAPQDLRNDGASTSRSGDSDGSVEEFPAADDSFPSHELGDLLQDGTILADGTNVADWSSACAVVWLQRLIIDRGATKCLTYHILVTTCLRTC